MKAAAAAVNGHTATVGFRVTHVDANLHRSLGVFLCAQRSAAEALALAMWGPPVYMAAMRLPAARLGDVRP